MRRIGAALILIFIVGITFSQHSDDGLLDNLFYAKAIKSYEKELKKNPQDSIVRHNLAIAYNKTGQSDKAFEQYLQLISIDFNEFNAEDWNNIAQYSTSAGLVDLSDIAYDKLTTLYPDYSYQTSRLNEKYYKAENYLPINSSSNDFSPVFYNGIIVFTSDRASNVYDLSKDDWNASPFLSVFTFDTLSNKTKVFGGDINHEGHNGPISFSESGDIAYVTHASKEAKKGINHSKVLITTSSKADKWDIPIEYNLNEDNSFSCAHAVLLDELNMMVFSSNKPGGSGEMDLYYITFGEGNGFSEPINITTINTPFNDVFPCKDDNDPNSLYFSSNGYRGFGGLDIYKTTFVNGKWSTPKLMPKAINSSYDDFGIVFTSQNTGFVSSNRIGGSGGDDIYSFIQSDKFILEGYLVDEEKHLPLPLQKVYIIDEHDQIIDSVISNEEGYFNYAQLPYQKVGLQPASEDGTEMVIRPIDQNLPKDPYVNIQLMSSKGFVDDSIALEQPEIITYVIETYKGKRSRCVVFENGDKAVAITFYVKSREGKIIDYISTGTNGCFKLEKLYPEGSFLELFEEFLELKMRIVDQPDEEKNNWQEATSDIRIITDHKCVEYEDGAPAINVSFAVKDKEGNIVDKIVTNQNGCFSVRKLYDDDTYLELIEESLVDLGMKLMPPFDDSTFSWQKSDDRIIIKYGRKCMVFKAGGHPNNAKYLIKDQAGNTVEGSVTDENGCLKVKKLYGDDEYMVYVLDEEGLTYSAKMDKDKRSYLLLDRTEIGTEEFEYVTITVKRCVEYEDGDKAVEIRFAVMSESDQKMDQLITDQHGCFTIRKLYDKSHLKIDDEELVTMGIQFKNPSDAVDNWYLSEKRIVLTLGKKCLTYENGDEASNAGYNIRNEKDEIVESSITDLEGCLKMKKLYGDGNYYIELLDEEGLAIKIPIEKHESTETTSRVESKVVLNNIYFDFGSYNLSSESKKILKELANKMKNDTGLSLNVHAHTDSRGSEKINEELSQKRADAVAKYLISQGISKHRIATFGHGESQLLNGCDDNTKCSDQEHAKNRRIEFEYIRG